MRIYGVRAENFKRFADQAIEFDRQFTLLVGDNGSGKTTVLDALAVSLGVWLVEVPDSTLQNSKRSILPTEIRLEPSQAGDRLQFRERLPVVVTARGQIGGHENVSWSRQIRPGGKRTTNAEAVEALAIIRDLYRRDTMGEAVICPVLAYYGAGRAWLPSNERRRSEPRTDGSARRWAAFHDCFSECIRFGGLRAWFHRETTAAGVRGGRMRPGFEVVKRSVLRCVPGADGLWFDPDRGQVVLSMGGHAQPFENLSAGQRMMLSLVADIAIKAVTQNAHLLPPDHLGPEDEPVPRVLRDTPGVVLIDELDVHLHPRWQRQVAADLMRTFPAVQFVCTSHSPQVIGELRHEQIRMLDGETITIPPRSLGIDSNRILDELMETCPRDPKMEADLRELFQDIDREDFEAARGVLSRVERLVGTDDPEVTRARALMAFLEETA